MFNEERLLDCVAYGSEFGQEFSTRIVQLRSGQERRNINWSMPLGRYSVVYTALKPEDHIKVRSAHMASMGSAIPFRFKDWTDYVAVDEVIGVASGESQTMQLIKTYKFGVADLKRIIKKPVANKVEVFANGVPLPVIIDYTTGIVTLTANDGDVISWTGEFDIPVRFESDRLDVDPVVKVQGGFALSTDAGLVEVRLP